MRKVPVLLFIILLFSLASGCSEAPPAQPTVAQTSATATPSPEITLTLPVSLMTPPSTASVSDNTITIVKNTFRPANMTVKIGSTVRWVNADDHPHRIAFTKEGFLVTPYLLGSSQSASQRFDSAGTYDFYCTIHPQMQGTIIAEA
jgi:plastocyanin